MRSGSGVPPSTAVVLGQISGSPRRVHMMSSVVLSSLLRRGSVPVKLPTLVQILRLHECRIGSRRGRSARHRRAAFGRDQARSRATVRALLEAPLCYATGKTPAGTLRSLSHWCAARRNDMRFHFAKTGTQVTEDPNATVDVWTTGGLQFSNGAAYSYVVLVGTGSVREPWATSLHASQIAAPLLEVLLNDLKALSRSNPQSRPPAPATPPAKIPVAAADGPNRKLTAAEETLRSLGNR